VGQAVTATSPRRRGEVSFLTEPEVIGIGIGCPSCRHEVLVDLTMTDAVGLHVMKELGIRTCWSTEFHLGLAGASLIIDEP